MILLQIPCSLSVCPNSCLTMILLQIPCSLSVCPNPGLNDDPSPHPLLSEYLSSTHQSNESPQVPCSMSVIPHLCQIPDASLDLCSLSIYPHPHQNHDPSPGSLLSEYLSPPPPEPLSFCCSLSFYPHPHQTTILPQVPLALSAPIGPPGVSASFPDPP